MHGAVVIKTEKQITMTERQLGELLTAAISASAAPNGQMDRLTQTLERGSVPQNATLWAWVVSWGVQHLSR